MEPLELVALSGQEEVVDVGHCLQIALVVCVHPVRNLTLVKPHLLHIVLHDGKPGKWRVASSVQSPQQLSNIFLVTFVVRVVTAEADTVTVVVESTDQDALTVLSRL